MKDILRSKLQAAVLITAILASAFTTVAQDVTHPLSGVSSTAAFYSYIHPTSATTGVDIKYFIVRAPNGNIKSAFDACDVCWAQFKGYVQIGSFMRCVNCGNTYPIDDLGSQGTGGCWPKYLPHTEDATNVILTKADLATGAPYFKTVTIAGVAATELPSDWIIAQHTGGIDILAPQIGSRTISLVDMSGRLVHLEIGTGSRTTISTDGLSAGIYMLNVQQDDNYYARKIAINK